MSTPISTKEQERAALEQIKAILATLEPGSYVRSAFEGCAELAAENIKNDYCQTPEETWGRVTALTEQRIRAEVGERLATLEQAALSHADLVALYRQQEERIDALTARVEHAKEGIVRHADEPEKAPFINARGEYHMTARELAEATALCERIEAAGDAAAKL